MCDTRHLIENLVAGCLFWQVGSSKVCFCNFYNILPYVINSGSEIVGAVGECTVGSIFDAKSPIVSVMDTHARFIIFQMIAAFCVTCRPVKIGAPVNKQKNQNINKKIKNSKKKVTISKKYQNINKNPQRYRLFSIRSTQQHFFNDYMDNILS